VLTGKNGVITLCRDLVNDERTACETWPTPRERALGRLKLGFNFSPFMDQNLPNWVCRRMRRRDCIVCNGLFYSTISCFVPEIFAIELRSCPKCGPNFEIFGPTNFWGRDPKFLTQFYKLRSPSNVCQKLVTIDRAISEIRRWKKKQEACSSSANRAKPL